MPTNRRALGAVHVLVVVAAFLGLVSGCAARANKQSSVPESAPQAYGQAGYPAQAAQAQPAYAPPPPISEAAPASPLALRDAARELDSSQRELDVAGSDCRNACRALGSMDRAAGRLCQLSQGAADETRCTDAKHRVYSARDRVRASCGSCPDGPSVERTAPIPSLR